MGALLGGFARWFAMGLGWGVLARYFMRLVSTEPGFSWPGTLMILGLAGMLFGLVGLVVAARASSRTRWWRLAPLPGLILFAGPGMVLAPGALVVATGLACRGRVLRAMIVAAGCVGTYALLVLTDDEMVLAPRTQTAGFLLAVVAVAWLGVALHAWWRRWRPAETEEEAEPKAGSAAYSLG